MVKELELEGLSIEFRESINCFEWVVNCNYSGDDQFKYISIKDTKKKNNLILTKPT